MPLELEKIPSTPCLVPRFEPALAGVDFLNLRQTNFDLMDECMPGTNNATKLVRGYGLMTWVYWIYPRILQRMGREEADSEELIHFREKVESLYIWGHQLAGLGGVPGISAKAPKPRDGRCDLRFKAWNRSRANTSFEAAVQYGPSLLDLGGLGLLQKIAPGIYVCSKAGAPLGEALDERLRESPAYGFLTDIANLEGTPEQAEALLPYWRFDESSPAEAAAFRSVLWDPSVIDEKSARGRRAAMVELILSILETASEPLDVPEIRQRMALPHSWTKEALTGGILRQSRSWFVLQARQLERMALESLMSWLESQLLQKGHLLPDALVSDAFEAMVAEYGFEEGTTTDDALKFAGEPIAGLEQFQQLIEEDPDWYSPWSLAGELREAVVEGTDTAVTTGFYSLLLLHQCRPFLEEDELLSRHLELGGATRVSLAHWFRLIERFRNRPFRELMDWVIKNFVISQHLAVGTQRFDGEKIRLRMILEEDGLESLVRSPWQPDLTPDRLATLLSLMTSCGAIVKMGDGYAIRSHETQ
jgi:hypothetical protein